MISPSQQLNSSRLSQTRSWVRFDSIAASTLLRLTEIRRKKLHAGTARYRRGAGNIVSANAADALRNCAGSARQFRLPVTLDRAHLQPTHLEAMGCECSLAPHSRIHDVSVPHV
jgi:hypothetical protein